MMRVSPPSTDRPEPARRRPVAAASDAPAAATRAGAGSGHGPHRGRAGGPRRPEPARPSTTAKTLTYYAVPAATCSRPDVKTATIDNATGVITGKLTNGTELHGPGPNPLQPDRREHAAQGRRERQLPGTRPPNMLLAILPYLVLPFALSSGSSVFIEPPGPGPDVGDHVDRALQGQAVQRRAPVDHLRRRGRLRRRQAGDQRGRRLLEDPGPVQGDRGQDPEGRPAGRSAGHRQDPAGPGRGRRGRGAVPVGERLGLHGDVRRRRRQPGARPLPDRPQAGAGHRLRRRDRLDRPQAGRRASAAATTSASRPSTRCSPRWTASTRPRGSW